MLEQRRAQQKGFITLKEAAKFSSYSPDYIGQLIRSGKIEGEQVYSNVAWVTTEESVRNYMLAKNKSDSQPDTDNILETAENFGLYILYLVVGFLAVSVLVMFYIFAVSLDSAIERKLFTASVDNHTPRIEVVRSYE